MVMDAWEGVPVDRNVSSGDQSEEKYLTTTMIEANASLDNNKLAKTYPLHLSISCHWGYLKRTMRSCEQRRNRVTSYNTSKHQ
jgi:hypothetical protein